MRGWMPYIARTRSMTHQVEAYRRLRRHLENYCRTLVLAFDEQAAVTLQRLRRARIRIGTMDLKIAAIALSHVETRGWRNDQPPPRVTIAEAGATIALSRSVEVWMASSAKPSTPRPKW